MIKQIQLRGISRNPSDRMTADGGVAESLNVQIDQDENAPAPAPKEVRSFPSSITDVIFLHRGKGFSNAICMEGDNVVYYGEDNVKRPVLEISSGETVTSTSSIGNTLILCTEGSTYFALYKSGNYIPLGNEVPFPDVEIVAREISGTTKVKDTFTGEMVTVITDTRASDLRNSRDDAWNNKPQVVYTYGRTNTKKGENGIGPISPENINNYFSGTASELWTANQALVDYIKDKITIQDSDNSRRGIHTYPQWVVYGVRLYDGSTIASAPVLMNVAAQSPFRITVGNSEYFINEEQGYNNSTFVDCYVSAFLAQIERNIASRYYIRSSQLPANWKDWSDIIYSVDVYMSMPIGTVADMRATASNVQEAYVQSGKKNAARTFDIDFADNENTFEERCMMESTFHLVKRYRFTQFSEIVGTEFKFLDTRGKGTATELATQEILKDYDWTRYKKKFKEIQIINNRAIAVGASREIDVRQMFPTAICFQDREISSMYVEKSYPQQRDFSGEDSIYVRDNIDRTLMANTEIKAYRTPTPAAPWGAITGDHKLEIAYEMVSSVDVVAHKTYVIPGSYIIEGSTVYSVPMPMLLCPDSRCTKATLKYSAKDTLGNYSVLGYKRKNMSSSEYADFSFGYDSLSIPLANSLLNYEITFPEEVNKTEDISNYLYMSPIDNPFYYPESSKVKFLDDIIGAGLATRALSEGQFGQFPLIVFTKSGIWAMDMNETGDFVNQRAMDRSICINGGCIVPLENQIIFIADDGVKLVQGSEVICVSPSMKGKHWKITDRTGGTVISGMPDFTGLLPVLGDGESFMGFLKDDDGGCEGVYDYAGKRVILFRKGKSYAYVLKLDSNTWHKISIPEGYEYVRTINSYPQAYAVLEKSLAMSSGQQQGSSEESSQESGGTAGSSGPTIEEIGQEIEENIVAPLSIAMGNMTKTKSIHDFSTFLAMDEESEDYVERPVAIATRPFDLGEPDILKSISHIKIRGNYERYKHKVREFYKYYLKRTSTTEEIQISQSNIDNWNTFGVTLTLQQMRDLAEGVTTEVYLGTNDAIEYDDLVEEINASVQAEFVELKTEKHEEELSELDKTKPRVQYILLGSQDGINFHLVGSLRGKSWKLFRIIILAKLRPYERISWIDIEYESRFANKLR